VVPRQGSRGERPRPALTLSTTASDNKAVIRRLVDEVMNAGRIEAIDELYSPAAAERARRWIAPFRRSFPDVRMEIVDLVAECEKVAARFICTGTHLGDWGRHGPTRRRFRVDEVYFFELADGRITVAWGIEDTYRRLKQLRLLTDRC
jgi:predicted ester cyclase